MITDEQLTEWEDLCLLATPGPWTAVTTEPGKTHLAGVSAKGYGEIMRTLRVAGRTEGDENAVFISEARSALPQLLAEVRRLRRLETIVRERATPFRFQQGDYVLFDSYVIKAALEPE